MSKLLIILIPILMLFGCTEKSPTKPQTQTASPQQKVSYYENETVGYKMPYNKDWKTMPLTGDTDIMIVSKDGSFSPDPCINISSIQTEKYDLWDKDNQAKIRKEIDPKLKPAEENNVTLAGGPAYNLVYGLEKNGISIILSQTYLFHNGYFVVITCSAREEEYNRFDPIFEKVIKSIDFY